MSIKESPIPFPKPKDDQGIFEALYETFTLFVDHLEGRKEPRVLLAYPKIRFNRNVDINWDALGKRAADPAAWPTFDQAEIFSDIERVQVTMTKEEGKLLPTYDPPPRTFYLNGFKPIDKSKNLYWAYQPIDSNDAAQELNSFYYLRGLTYDIVKIANEDQEHYTTITGHYNKGIEDYLLPNSLMQLSPTELDERTTFGTKTPIELPDEYWNKLLSKAPTDIQEKARKQDYSEHKGEISPGLSWARYNRVQDEGTVSGYILQTIKDYHRLARIVIGWKIPFDEPFSSDMLNYSKGDIYIDPKTGKKYRTEYDPLIEIQYGDTTLYFNILPLTIDPIAKEAYYHFVVSLGFKEGTRGLDERTEAERQDVYAGLLKEIKKNLPKTIPTPEVQLPTRPRTIPTAVYIDRTTEQDLLPALLHKGIFTNYATLETATEILTREAQKTGKGEITNLTPEECREALGKAREYKDGGKVWRDYGDHRIGFSARLYLEYLNLTEDAIKEKALQINLFEEQNKQIAEALKNVKLYTIAHDMVHIVLSEVYTQQKAKGLEIPTATLLEYLGRLPGDPHIYEDIQEAIFSLRWIDYQHQEFNYTKEGKISRRRQGLKLESVGTFLYNITNTGQSYIVDVNENFIGCVTNLWGEKNKSKRERKSIFGPRGYYPYIPKQISHAHIQGYSYYGKLYLNWLLKERGNPRLKDHNFKIIAQPIRVHLEAAQIKGKRPNDAFRLLVEALKELSQVIHKTEPTIQDLQDVTRPSKMLDETLRVWVLKDAEKIVSLMDTLDQKKK